MTKKTVPREQMIIPPEMFGLVFGQVLTQFRPIAIEAAKKIED
jgi:hypothetical protein